MGMHTKAMTTTTDFIELVPAGLTAAQGCASAAEKPIVKKLIAQNYEAAPAAANFLILFNGTTEIMRFPLPACGAPLILLGDESNPVIPGSKFTAGAALQAKLSAAGTVYVMVEYCHRLGG